MAAPLGFKTFATGDVLTAADTNGYLMQGVWAFANATARDAAVTSPQQGNMCFLKDSNTTQYYSGSAWTAVSATATTPPVNLLLNSNFALNQRAYVSGATLASGVYGFDRWKSNFATTTLTYTASTQGQTLTVNTGGGIQQVIEQGLVPAGTYTLSWTGTATARVYNSGGTPPSYAASPVTFTADGTANVIVEFTAVGVTKTISKVQFNAGTNTIWAQATPTIATELAACQRYYWRENWDAQTSFAVFASGSAASTTSTNLTIQFPVQMRVKPTALDFPTPVNSMFVVVDANAGGAGASAISQDSNQTTSYAGLVQASVASGLTQFRPYILRGNNTTGAYLGWSAEL